MLMRLLKISMNMNKKTRRKLKSNKKKLTSQGSK
jgi:hypothetical protein